MIRCDELSVRYRPSAPVVLSGVDLTVREGELAVVAGPTGAGKSTLLGCLTGLVPHFTGGVVYGRVVVGGRDTRTHRPGDLSDLVGYVGQDPAAGFVTDSVEEELAYSLECFGTAPTVMRRRVEDILDLLGLAPLRARRLRTLSGGEQQRVAIGAAMVTGSRVLVLDEPTSALDPAGAEDVLAAVHRLVHDLGVTAVMTEHRLERALQFADQVILVEGGHVRAGDAATIMADSPVAPPVVELARLAGWSPTPVTVRDARRHAASLRASLGSPADTIARTTMADDAGERVTARVRGLRVNRGRARILHGVDLTLRSGEVAAVMGRNGAGKSTLLSAIAGLIDREGAVHVGDVDPATAAPGEAIRLVGLVPENPRLLLYAASVEDECAGADHDTGAGRGATRRTLARLAPELAEPAALARHPNDLSEGQRLMLALAVVLAVRPALLLLDEPTRGLDYAAKASLASHLRGLAADGHAVAVATHDVEFTAELADRVVTLADGVVIADGPAGDVLLSSNVNTPQVAKILRPHRWMTVAAVAAAMHGRHDSGPMARGADGDPTSTRRSDVNPTKDNKGVVR